MEDHNLDIVLFSEMIRKQMQRNNPPLIKYRRRQIIWTFSDVFLGFEAVAWATKTLTIKDGDRSSPLYLNEQQACTLFQKLMDAGLLQNVTNLEQFKTDKSFYRFSSDDNEAETLIRSIALGYRLFDSAISPGGNLFEKVYSLGLLVSTECLKASQIVTLLVNNGFSSTRDSAIQVASEMVKCNVLKPVDPEVKTFVDGNTFYMFAIDYRRPLLTVNEFLNNHFVTPLHLLNQQVAYGLRNKYIHLRQTSDNLLDLDHLSIQSSRHLTEEQLEDSSSSTNSDSNGNTINSSPPPTYQSLLNSDGSMSKAALFHPSAPFVKKEFCIYPDAVGYGFVLRGNGPCFVKIVDPDSPAGKAGLKARQYIISINRNDVTEMAHTGIEDLILFGPRLLKITVMQSTAKSEGAPRQSSVQPSSKKR